MGCQEISPLASQLCHPLCSPPPKGSLMELSCSTASQPTQKTNQRPSLGTQLSSRTLANQTAAPLDL